MPAIVTQLQLVEDHELTAEEKEELDFFEQIRRKQKSKEQALPATTTNLTSSGAVAVGPAAPPAAEVAPAAPRISFSSTTSSTTTNTTSATSAGPVRASMARPMTKMTAVVPSNVFGGMQLRVTTPHGLMEVTVPPGMGPGMAMEMWVPQLVTPNPGVQHRLCRANVIIPVGVCGGQQLCVQTPAGLMKATVPLGLQAGQSFTISFPVASPAAGAPTSQISSAYPQLPLTAQGGVPGVGNNAFFDPRLRQVGA